jgi:hypothetical protein
MSTELRVLVAHLGDLAAKQDEAAAVVGSAAAAADGVDVAVSATHGAIAAATAAAVTDAAQARTEAGAHVEAVSRELRNRLGEAAASYARTDEVAAEEIGS